MRNDIKVIKEEAWGINDQRQFANELRNQNWDAKLNVPDSDLIRQRLNYRQKN